MIVLHLNKKLFKDKIKEENNLKVQNKKRDEKIDCLKKIENNTKKLINTTTIIIINNF